MEVKKIWEKIRRQQEKKYFLALQLTDTLVKSSLWIVEGEGVKILLLGEKQFLKGEGEILEEIDASLPPTEEEPQGVIFGVSPDWTDGNNILPGKLALLQKICKEFAFSAIGFVIIPEAVVYYLKSLEGIPPTAVLVFLEKEKIFVTLVKLGKIIGTQTVKRSENLGADIVEGLFRFKQEEAFPARILLYGEEEDLEKEKQKLMAFSWEEAGINFFHLPKIEILPPNFDIYAVTLAGGREVGGVNKLEVVFEKAKQEITSLPEKLIPKEEKEEIIEEGTEETAFGFVKGEDITQQVEEKPAEDFFAPPPKIKRKISFPKINLTPFFNFFSKISLRPFFSSVFPQKRLIGGLTLLFLILTGGILFLGWWYLLKAEVILWVTPQSLEKDLTVTLDSKAKVADSQKLILPAEKIEITLEGEKTKETTGTKLVGEPAKGEVTIYNRTIREKTFEAGTEIIGPNNLKFTLDEEVRIASESAGPDYTRIPGKAKVKVTAVNIGSEGNLAAGTEFSIANFSKSDYVAKNEEAFTGGTSRQVQVVSKNDQEKLLEELTSELKQKAGEELKKKLPEGKKLIEESITSKIIEKSFDKKIDEEAEEIKLTASFHFSALIFSQQEFQKIVEDQLLRVIPEGFEYRANETQLSFDLKNINASEQAIFLVHFKTFLFPKLDLEAIKNNLAGKYPEIGKAYLESFSGVEAVEIKIMPRLPKKLMTFPRRVKNIKIELVRK